MEHAQIVSIPMPGGVSWLLNVLLELNVRLTSYKSYWAETPEGSRLEPPETLSNLLWHLPALHRREAFPFEPGFEVFWEHRLDYSQYPGRKTLVYVRDPRDTAYSHYQRLAFRHPDKFPQTIEGFVDFIKEVHTWPDHFRHLFGMPNPDSQAYFYLFWLRYYAPEQQLVVRHEDSKRDPFGQLQRILDFWGLERSREDMERAIELSDIKHALQLTKKMLTRTSEPNLSNRSGAVNEWKKTFTPEALACFAGPAAKMIEVFGYDDPPQSPEPPVEIIRSLQLSVPLIDEFRQLLAPGKLALAENFLLNGMSALTQEQLPVFGALLISLRWTYSILGEAQYQLPHAARMAQIFMDLNLEWLVFPYVHQACIRILHGSHLLHHLPAPEAILLAGNEPLPDALDRARGHGFPFVFWQRPGLLLEGAGFYQMQALFDGRNPSTEAVVPVFEPTLDPDAVVSFRAAAEKRQASQGAEAVSCQLQDLPACLMLRSDLEPTLPLESWLASLQTQRAEGVLCRDLAPAAGTAQQAGTDLGVLAWIYPEDLEQAQESVWLEQLQQLGSQALVVVNQAGSSLYPFLEDNQLQLPPCLIVEAAHMPDTLALKQALQLLESPWVSCLHRRVTLLPGHFEQLGHWLSGRSECQFRLPGISLQDYPPACVPEPVLSHFFPACRVWRREFLIGTLDVVLQAMPGAKWFESWMAFHGEAEPGLAPAYPILHPLGKAGVFPQFSSDLEDLPGPCELSCILPLQGDSDAVDTLLQRLMGWLPAEVDAELLAFNTGGGLETVQAAEDYLGGFRLISALGEPALAELWQRLSHLSQAPYLLCLDSAGLIPKTALPQPSPGMHLAFVGDQWQTFQGELSAEVCALYYDARKFRLVYHQERLSLQAEAGSIQ
ncbi:MAG: sulfotransferase domain-containing protein [Candidatus Sericytochromatia bacterium]